MSLTAPATLQPFLARPVAIFGGGVSGDGVCALVERVGAASVVYDQKSRTFGAAEVDQHRLVVYSPGFVPDHPWIRAARDAGMTCLGELDFAALFWRGGVFAITGTNGKTTTTEFLTHALQQVGQRAVATGNIGHSFSRVVAEQEGGTPDTLAVCEVSSFQAETLDRLVPDAMLWTNFAEDHLERHPGLAAYFAAKWKLVERTLRGGRRPAVFIGTSVAQFARELGYDLGEVTCVDTVGSAGDPRLANTVFATMPQRENFLLVRALWEELRLNLDALHAAAANFKLGRHRLARVGEWNGVTYWNDSKATNFHAVEAAVAGFATPVWLIAGGKAKGGDLGAFVSRLRGRVQRLLLIGDTAGELARQANAAAIPFSINGNLAAAVGEAVRMAPPGSHVLLSPGFASFDQFRSYEDRGNQFEKLVREFTLEKSGTRPSKEANLG